MIRFCRFSRPLRLATLLLSGMAFAPTTCGAAPVAASDAQALARILNVDRQVQIESTNAATTACADLIRDNLRSLDPDGRLSGHQQQVLKARLEADIHPIVEHALRKAAASCSDASLSGIFEQRIAATNLLTLLRYFKSPQGRRYLTFTAELDTVIGSSMDQLARQPFSFNRKQLSDQKAMARRQALIAMSTPARQLRQAHRGNAGLGVAQDWISILAGERLDHLASLYATDLSAFSAFQQSPAAVQLDGAQAEWIEQCTRKMAPEVEQAKQDTAPLRTKWQSLVRSMQRTTVSSSPAERSP